MKVKALRQTPQSENGLSGHADVQCAKRRACKPFPMADRFEFHAVSLEIDHVRGEGKKGGWSEDVDLHPR